MTDGAEKAARSYNTVGERPEGGGEGGREGEARQGRVVDVIAFKRCRFLPGPRDHCEGTMSGPAMREGEK